MALAIFFSYAIQFYVPVDIINSYIQERISPDKHLKVEYLLRLGLVLFTFSLAAAIPKLDLFISLVGSVSSSTLALMAPSIIDTVTAGQDCSRSALSCQLVSWLRINKQECFRLRLLKNSLIFLFGFIGFATGTYVSISNIITYFVNEN